MNRPGDRVGPFELIELIAARPLANLWRAERVEASGHGPRTVVIRVAHHAMDSRAMSELRKEYDALRAVSDPRVRKAHGFFAGFGAVALEFVDGVSLEWVLQHAAQGGPSVDLPTVVDIAVELMGALRSVHAAGLAHGRICVDTVRLRRDGGVVLTDFTFPAERLAVLPPELKQGMPATAATDQWLVAALIVHLVTGRALLGGKVGDPADGRRDLRGDIGTVSAECPPVGRVVARMLARDPRDRYADDGLAILDLLGALRSLEGQPSRERLARAGRPPTTPPLLPPPIPVMRPLPTMSPAPPIRLASPAVAPRIRRHAEDTTGVPATEIITPGEAQRSWTPTGPELVAVVHEEEDTEIPEAEHPGDAEVEPEVEPIPASPTRRRRSMSDGVAAFALVLLLAVGAWAVLSRLF